MPSNVPTMDEFNALTLRVAALETGTEPEPPDPNPEPPDPNPEPPDPETEGVQAKRVSWLCEMMGVNTFSSMDEGNVWGSWPADYRPETVIRALQQIIGDSGFQIPIREYHYNGRQSWQTPWLRQIRDAIPGTVGTVCVGCNGSVHDADSVRSMCNDDPDLWKWGEGINEPNMDFGLGGTIGSQQTTDIQSHLQGAPRIMGPSVVFGLPNAHAYIEDYFAPGHLEQVNAMLDHGNGHYYPPHCPDIVGDGASLTDVVGSLWTVYDQHTTMLTEIHPSLYNMTRSQQQLEAGRIIKRIIAFLAGRGGDVEPPPIPAVHAMEDRDDYYTMLMIFRSAQCGVTGLWWYALFDYADVYECGLYPRNADNPRKPALALARLMKCTGDRGDRYGFEPHKLGYTVEGLDSDCAEALYESSDGRFFITLWRSAEMPGGTPKPVTFTFNRAAFRITEYDLCASDEPVQQRVNATQLTSQLTASCRIIAIEP